MDAEVIAHLASKKENKDPNGRKVLDVWFPTIVRYVGIGLLVYAALVDKGKNPALLPTAAGMILFKTVLGSPEEK